MEGRANKINYKYFFAIENIVRKQKVVMTSCRENIFKKEKEKRRMDKINLTNRWS